MHALYRFGSIEKFVLSVVEYDAPGRVIFALSQHMVWVYKTSIRLPHTILSLCLERVCFV